jgi:hypothetical protein
MNNYREVADPNFDAPGRDPLERLVEAFVELSVPEGPDAAVQRSLVARLTSGTIELAPPPAATERTSYASRTARWSFVLQTLATAAVIAVAATAIFTMLRRDPQPEPSAPGAQDIVEVPMPSPDASVAAPGEDLENIAAWVSKALKRQSELAKSDSWRQAHERVSSALDRPEVLGLGFGLLGTFPWASYARF